MKIPKNVKTELEKIAENIEQYNEQIDHIGAILEQEWEFPRIYEMIEKLSELQKIWNKLDDAKNRIQDLCE